MILLLLIIIVIVIIVSPREHPGSSVQQPGHLGLEAGRHGGGQGGCTDIGSDVEQHVTQCSIRCPRGSVGCDALLDSSLLYSLLYHTVRTYCFISTFHLRYLCLSLLFCCSKVFILIVFTPVLTASAAAPRDRPLPDLPVTEVVTKQSLSRICVYTYMYVCI